VPEDGTKEQTPGYAPGPPSAAPARTATADVFISYASADKTAADSICAALEHAGITCWIAPRDVTPGVFYADAIVEAINSSRILIVVLSVNSAGSQHVLREVERASSKRRPLVAFRLDTTPLPTGLEYFLSASHWLDASASPIDRALPGLVDAVHRLLGGSQQPPADAAANRGRAQKSHRKLLWSGAALAAVLLLSLLAGKLWLSSRSKPEIGAPVASTAPTISEKSIAVLPFADMSEKHDQEYFANGLSEELTDVLGKLPGLRVTSHGSAFRFKGQSVDLGAVGAQLGTVHIVQGSVRRSGDTVRITAQLIRTSDGAHEWSGTYDRRVSDVLQLQSEIAMSLGRALELSIPNLSKKRATVVPEAYDFYLRGLHSVDKYSRDGFEEADSYFQRAIELDPGFIRSYEELAGTHLRQAAYGFVPVMTGFAQVRDDATRLLQLDPKSSWGHAILCRYHVSYSWNWSEAGRECADALALAPHDWVVLFEAAELALAVGESENAARLFREVLAIDPLNADTHVEISLPLLQLGRLREAEAAVRRGLAITPTYAEAHYVLGTILMAEGRFEDALREFELEAPEGGQQAGLAMGYHALGRDAESKAALARFTREHSDDEAFNVAEVYGYLGDPDHALQWLERAYRQKDVALQYLKSDWPLRRLEHDARYKAFLRMMNLPE